MSDFINKISELNQTISNFGEETKSFFKAIESILFYLTHPKDLAMTIWDGAVAYGFYICLAVTMVGIILYIIGVKGGAKYSKIAFFSYLTIQIFNAVSR